MKQCISCKQPKAKDNHTKCRKCYLGKEKYLQEKQRLSKIKEQRKYRRPKWQCDMNYTDCNLRKFCNGDC